jgi:hypothetical protein
MRFFSTHLNTLSVSPVGGPPAAAGPLTTTGPASGRGRCLVLENYAGCTGPTSTHNRYIYVRYSGIQIFFYIYNKK